MAAMRDPFHWRRFAYVQLAFVSVLAVGTVVFHAILGEGWVASFYRTVVSTTLTGLDTQPEGAGAQLFTIVLLLGVVAIFLYLAGAIADLIANGALSDAYAERKLRRTIDDLSEHAIICGCGRVGRGVAAEFASTGTPYVVVESTPRHRSSYWLEQTTWFSPTTSAGLQMAKLEALFAPREVPVA